MRILLKLVLLPVMLPLLFLNLILKGILKIASVCAVLFWIVIGICMIMTIKEARWTDTAILAVIGFVSFLALTFGTMMDMALEGLRNKIARI